MRSLIFADAVFLQLNVPIELLADAVEDASGAFDRAAIDDPGHAPLKLFQEVRFSCADTGQARHRGSALTFQL